MKSVSKETFLKGKIINLFFFLSLSTCAVLSHSVVSDSLRPHRLQPARVLCPWDSQAKNTGVGCHALLQGIFPTQGSNPGLSHCRWILYHLSCLILFSLSVYLPLPFLKSSSLAQSARKSIKWARMPWVCTLLKHQPNSGPFLCHELDNCLLIFFFNMYLFIWLHLVLDAACRIFPFGM